MISVTEVVQQYVPGTSTMKITSIIRANHPCETLEEYVDDEFEEHILSGVRVTSSYCKYSKRYTVQIEKTIRMFSLTDDFGSHWVGRDDKTHPNISRYQPFNITMQGLK